MAPGNRTLFLNGRIPRRFGNSTDSVILQQLGTRSENRTSKTASVVCLIEVKSTYFFFLKKRISFDNYIKRRRRRKVKQESKSQRWGEGLFVGRWIWFGLVGLSQNSKAGVRILSLLRFRYRALSPLISHIAHHLNSQAYHIALFRSVLFLDFLKADWRFRVFFQINPFCFRFLSWKPRV